MIFRFAPFTSQATQNRQAFDVTSLGGNIGTFRRIPILLYEMEQLSHTCSTYAPFFKGHARCMDKTSTEPTNRYILSGEWYVYSAHFCVNLTADEIGRAK